MKLRILSVGRPKEPFVVQGVREYLKRLGRHLSCDLIHLAETKGLAASASREETTRRALKALGVRDYVVLLDEEGPLMGSPAFSHWFYDRLDGASGQLVFVVGGAYGVGEELKRRADALLSLSPMTLTHELALLFFMEQLYRGVMIRLGTSYHH